MLKKSPHYSQLLLGNSNSNLHTRSNAGGSTGGVGSEKQTADDVETLQMVSEVNLIE